MDMSNCSFISAMKDYFGFKPEQKLMDFRNEIGALTPDDRKYFIVQLAKVGYTVQGE